MTARSRCMRDEVHRDMRRLRQGAERSLSRVLEEESRQEGACTARALPRMRSSARSGVGDRTHLPGLDSGVPTGRALGSFPPEQAVRAAFKLAKRHHRRWRDEFESEALLAYVRAMRSWRASGGASFKTYAYRRMRGAIVDRAREIIGRRSRAENCTTDGFQRAAQPVSLPGWVAAREAWSPRDVPTIMLKLALCLTVGGTSLRQAMRVVRAAWL